MAKFDFKQFMLAKGEKIALGAGLAGLGLFGVLGVMSAVSAESPSKTTAALKTGAQNVNSKIANTTTTAPPLPEWIVVNQPSFTVIDEEPFASNPPYFEPVDFPSQLRENPKVLGITAAQLDLSRAAMKAYDIRVMQDGTRQIGVLSRVKVKETDLKAVEQMLKGDPKGSRLKGQRQGANRPQPPGAGAPGGAGGMMGGRGPGGMMGGRGGPPGMGGGEGDPGGLSGMGGYGGMFGGGGFSQQGERYEATVAYIPVDEFDSRKHFPAFTVFPLRMVIVHASFPLKEQLEEIKRALRLKTIEEARQLSIPGSGGATSGGMPATPGGGNRFGGRGGVGTGDGGDEPGGIGMGGSGGAVSFGQVGGPIFAGFEVRRRVTAPDGTQYDWADYDHESIYVNQIWSRKVTDQPDDGYLAYFLRYDQMMAMPLPSLADGLAAYPEIRLPPIVSAVEKMKKLARRPVPPSEQQQKFNAKASGNPFLPQGGGAGGAGDLGGFLGQGGMGPGVGSPTMPGGGGMQIGGRGGPGMGMPGGPPGGYPPGYGSGSGRGGPGMGMPGGPPGGYPPGYGSGSGGRGPGMGMPGAPGGQPGGYPPGYTGGRGPGMGMPGMGMPGAPGMGMPGAPGQYGLPQQSDTPEKDHLMLRFFDPDVRPGFTYEYMIRVKIKNPNLGRKDVGRPDDALHEVLTGSWVTINTPVTVTSELNLYATDPVEYTDKIKEKYKDQAVVNLLDNRGGYMPVVQIQQWLEQVNIESKREPVGTWVVGEVPVQRGEYIGRRQIVPLPMWSAEKTAYLLQELPRYKVWKAREQPKGLLVDFETRYVLVDYEGGKVRPQVADRGIEDLADTEMLILRPDGSLTVFSSKEDIADKERAERSKNWENWIDLVTKTTQQRGLPTMPGDPSGGGFGRGKSSGGGAGSPDG